MTWPRHIARPAPIVRYTMGGVQHAVGPRQGPSVLLLSAQSCHLCAVNASQEVCSMLAVSQLPAWPPCLVHKKGFLMVSRSTEYEFIWNKFMLDGPSDCPGLVNVR